MSKNSSPLKLLEKRQLAKVEPLERPSLAGVDPKIARSLIRVYRKELKLRQQAVYIDAAKEAGLGSIAATIYSGGQVTKSVIDGTFNVISRVAQSNPLVFAAEAVTAVAVLEWFVDSFPKFSHWAHLDVLASKWGPAADLSSALSRLTDMLQGCRQQWYDKGWNERSSSYVAFLTANLNSIAFIKTAEDLVKGIAVIGPIGANESAQFLLGVLGGKDFVEKIGFKCLLPPSQPPPPFAGPAPTEAPPYPGAPPIVVKTVGRG